MHRTQINSISLGHLADNRIESIFSDSTLGLAIGLVMFKYHMSEKQLCVSYLPDILIPPTLYTFKFHFFTCGQKTRK
jgi:hypothetical protein